MKRVQKSVMTVIAASLLSTTPAWAAAQAAVVYGEPAAAQVTVQVSSAVAPDTSVSKAVELIPSANDATSISEQPELSEKASEALNRLYQLVPELKEIELKGKHYSPASGERPTTWFLHFSSEPEGPHPSAQGPYAHAYVSLVDETGQILSFDIQYPQWASDEFPSIEQAKAVATAFLQRLLGEQFDDYQMNKQTHYAKSGYSDEHGNKVNWSHVNVEFNRLVNGIPLYNHGYRVAVDAKGRVNAVYGLNEQMNDASFAPAAFPDPAKAIPVAEAEQTYRKLLDMELVYRAYGPDRPMPLVVDTDGETPPVKPILTYVPRFAGMLDAVSGEPANLGFADSKQQKPKNLTIQPQGKQLVVKNGEEAANLLTEVLGIDMSTLKAIDSGESEWALRAKHRYYSWHSESTPDPTGQEIYRPIRYVHLVTDRDTGQVLSVYINDKTKQGAKPKISQEEAEKIAIQFLETHVDADVEELLLRDVYVFTGKPTLPDWVDESKIDFGMDEPPTYSFYFSEVHKGIPIVDRTYAVTIDAVSGEVSGLSLAPKREGEWTFPDPSDVVTPQEAADALIAANPLRLVYLWPEFVGQRAPAPLLLYVSDYSVVDGSYLDATSGKWVKFADDNQ